MCYPFIAAGKSLRSTGTTHPPQNRCEPRTNPTNTAGVDIGGATSSRIESPETNPLAHTHTHHFRINARCLLVHTNEFMSLARAETRGAGGNNLLVLSLADFLKQNVFLTVSTGEKRIEREHRSNHHIGRHVPMGRRAPR